MACATRHLCSASQRERGRSKPPSLGQFVQGGKFLPDPGRDHQLHSGHVTKNSTQLSINALAVYAPKHHQAEPGRQDISQGKGGREGPSLISPCEQSPWGGKWFSSSEASVTPERTGSQALCARHGQFPTPWMSLGRDTRRGIQWTISTLAVKGLWVGCLSVCSSGRN